jgi:hypothetical protein
LCGADLDELVVGEVDGAGAVEPQAVLILRMATLEERLGSNSIWKRARGVREAYSEHDDR